MGSSAKTEGDAEAWVRRLATPWGRLQSSLLRRRLVSWIGTGSLRSVLDVGCGLGDMTAALAAKTDKVTCVDRSHAMLDEAQARLSASKVPARFVHRDLDTGLRDLGTHDLVIGHNVIDYTADPRRSIRELAACVGPGGSLSLSFGNAASVALRHVVMTHDLTEGLRLVRLPAIGRLPGPCGESMRLRRVVVEEWLQDAGITVSHRAGVRVLNDLLPNELKTDHNWAAIEDLELELGERPELIDIGAIVHVLGSRD